MKGRRERWSESWRVASRFFQDLSERRWAMVWIALLSLGMAGLELLRPWPLKWVVDHALVPVGAVSLDPRQVIWLSVAIAALTAVGSAGIGYGREILLSGLTNGVTRSIRYRIFSHLSRLSPAFHARHKSGDLLVRLMGDAPMVTTMLVDAPVEIATRAVVVLGTVSVMLARDPWLTLTMGAAVPVLVLLVRWISASIRVAVKKQRRKEGDLADYLHEAIAATETIQALGRSEHVVRRFARTNRRSARAGVKASRLSARLSAMVESTLGIAVAGVLALGSFRVLSQDMTAGELVLFLSYVRSLVKPMRATSKNTARISKGTACGERILAILEAEGFVSSAPGAPAAPSAPDELAFVDVSYAYAGGTRALQGFSARFRRGELSALVGKSGAGKSTVAALALRLFDPTDGQVLLDGRPLSSFDLASMRGRMGLAQQRTAFFGESVRENMLLGRPDASDEEIWSALEEAGASAFVAAMPGALDERLGANGVGLSGGQLSRLSLARTLLRRSPVLIVDEPFAGLDRGAARSVAETLRRLAQERIVVVIAHDLEQLDAYDHIVFMDQGKKLDEGRHAELLQRVPLYRAVVRTSAEVSA